MFNLQILFTTMGAIKQSKPKRKLEKKRAIPQQHTAYKKAKINPENIFNTADVKRLFGISESCVKEWRRKKILPYAKVGGTIFYFKDIIIKMLEDRIIYPE